MSIRSHQAILIVWCLLSTSVTIAYASVWQNELTLWSHAAVIAPAKPRPWLHLALAFMERRQWREAQTALDHVAEIVNDSHVPAWDQAEGEGALLNHRLVLARLAGGRVPR